MKLQTLRVMNFRCCKDVIIDLGSMHALVGANNAGKSTILRALDFFFNAAPGKIAEESFWARQTTSTIRIEAIFDSLSEIEKKDLTAQVRPDSTIHLARTAHMEDGEVKIGQEYNRPQPQQEWLDASKINGENIKKWLQTPELLVANGKSFHEFLDGEKGVTKWKEKAAEFATLYIPTEDQVDKWSPNPQGFPGVLKVLLPHFEMIPAVRDIADESKVQKTNPFGRLIHHVLSTINPELKQAMAEKLRETTRMLNRESAGDRLQGAADIEAKLKTFLSELMPADIEIQFQSPSLESVLTSTKLILDDGFRGSIENKGHGLQRAVIFSILRAYADFMRTHAEKEKRTLILGVEEPELYMHPTAQRSIRKAFRSIADAGDQVIFSTHSPLLVDVAYFDEIIRIEGTEWKAEQPHDNAGACVFQLPMKAMIQDLETRQPKLKGITPMSMREHYSNAYSPTRNEGFFAKKVILVEGATESYCLPIYASAMGHEFDSLGIAVVESGGKNQMDRLYRIFNELGIPCFPVFDFDHGNADTDTIEASRDLLTMLKHEVTEIAEPVVCGTFACFYKTWESDVNAEIPNYEALAKEAKKALGPHGKPLKARFIAKKLTSQSPPFIPPSVKKVLDEAINALRAPSILAKPTTVASAPPITAISSVKSKALAKKQAKSTAVSVAESKSDSIFPDE